MRNSPPLPPAPLLSHSIRSRRRLACLGLSNQDRSLGSAILSLDVSPGRNGRQRRGEAPSTDSPAGDGATENHRPVALATSREGLVLPLKLDPSKSWQARGLMGRNVAPNDTGGRVPLEVLFR